MGLVECSARVMTRKETTMTEKTVTVHTTCGGEFEIAISELSDRQLKGLLAQNPDADPDLIADMRAELKRRDEQ